MLLPEQSKKHVDLLRRMEDNNLASLVNITGSFHTLGDAVASVSEEYEDTDLSCPSGVRAYLKKKKQLTLQERGWRETYSRIG